MTQLSAAGHLWHGSAALIYCRTLHSLKAESHIAAALFNYILFVDVSCWKILMELMPVALQLSLTETIIAQNLPSHLSAQA